MIQADFSIHAAWPAGAALVPRPRSAPSTQCLAPEKGALLVAGAWFRVVPFETRRLDEALSAPARTVGHACLLLRGRAGLVVAAEEAAEVCVRRGGPVPSAESAREKVVFAGLGDDTLVYQADRANASASLCACGNASGAAAALLARTRETSQVDQSLVLPEGRVRLRARVQPAEVGWVVKQSWMGVQFAVRSTRVGGHPVTVCTGTLNDYLLVSLPDRARLDAFGLDQALAFWAEARDRFGFTDPLRARLAALCLEGPTPNVKFFTCGRTHPGAPLTGLAALALASQRIESLASLARVGRVEHRRGTDSLPTARTTTGGIQIDLPPIHVQLRGV